MQPHVFMNGFVANRIARHLCAQDDKLDLAVVQIRDGRAVYHVIEKRDGARRAYWVSHKDGFVAAPEEWGQQ